MDHKIRMNTHAYKTVTDGKTVKYCAAWLVLAGLCVGYKLTIYAYFSPLNSPAVITIK